MNLQEGDHKVVVRAPSLATVQKQVAIRSGTPDLTVEVKLDHGWKLAGRVVVSPDNCVAGEDELPNDVSLTIVRTSETGESAVFRPRIDNEGSFFDVLAPGKYTLFAGGGSELERMLGMADIELTSDTTNFCLIVSPLWDGPQTASDATEACKIPPEREASLKAHPCRTLLATDFACALNGQVTNADGQPAPGLAVSVIANVEECDEDFYRRWMSLPPSRQRIRTATSDSSGTFAFDEMLCTGYLVVAEGVAGRYACGWTMVELDRSTTSQEVSLTVRRTGDDEAGSSSGSLPIK